ncbi:MAG TPA: efflux RND transporter periplasmic adaptor subunit [Chloroflexota bacterium]|nr:efflux RND transporter periplasmic adaptor subunit [Chloroflexota bacterium]
MVAVAASPSRRVVLHRLIRPLVLLLVVAAGLVYWQTRPAAPAGALVASGTIESEETNVAVELAGRIVELPVAEGDRVGRGDVLVRLDDAVARAQLAQAHAGLDAARANLALVAAGARPEEVRAAEAQAAQAAAARAAAEKALANARALRDNPQELTARISQAETAVQAAQARLEGVRAGPRGGELAAARTGREQARSTLTQLETTTRAQEKVAAEAVQASESRLQLLRQGARPEDVRAVELALDQAKNALWAQQIDRDAICGRAGGGPCDAAKARVAAAETAVTAAANALEKVRNGPLPDEVRIAETGVAQARADLAAKQEVSAPARAAARAALASADARVRDLEAGATDQERRIAQAGLEQAQRQLVDLRAMREEPLTANAQVDAAEGQLETARAAEAAARARVDGLRAGPTGEQVALARAGVAQAEAAIGVLEAQTAKTAVVAPRDGVVTRRSARLGEAAAPGAPLLAIAPLDELKLTVYVPEDRIGRVQLGVPVDVRVDSFPGESFPGAVTFISPRAEFTPRNVQTQSDRAKTVFAVKVRIPNQDGRLRPGMFADATLVGA